MATYNVSASVVELIDADSPERAVQYLHLRLHDAGFEVFEPEESNAFESDTNHDQED